MPRSQATGSVAALAPSTGACVVIDPATGQPTFPVGKITAVNGALGGVHAAAPDGSGFTPVNGTPRNRLAALDATTGALST